MVLTYSNGQWFRKCTYTYIYIYTYIGLHMYIYILVDIMAVVITIILFTNNNIGEYNCYFFELGGVNLSDI